ncbi:hypothetical protein FRC12_022448, partial [Ceratobasidium sp. 428]
MRRDVMWRPTRRLLETQTRILPANRVFGAHGTAYLKSGQFSSQTHLSDIDLRVKYTFIYMIPVTPPATAGQEVWARMPGRPEDPTGVESNVELMGFVLSESWLNGQRVGLGFVFELRFLTSMKVWRCRAFESYGVWTSHPEEEVLNIRSIRLPLSDNAQFKYGQQVQVRTSADNWVVGSGIVRKSGIIEAGWCERSP